MVRTIEEHMYMREIMHENSCCKYGGENIHIGEMSIKCY
jgi:hypothetical protein